MVPIFLQKISTPLNVVPTRTRTRTRTHTFTHTHTRIGACTLTSTRIPIPTPIASSTRTRRTRTLTHTFTRTPTPTLTPTPTPQMAFNHASAGCSVAGHVSVDGLSGFLQQASPDPKYDANTAPNTNPDPEYG